MKKKIDKTNGNKVFVYKYINKKNRWFVKAINLKRFMLPLFIATGKRGKHLRTSGNYGYFQDGGTLVSKVPAFKTLVAFAVLTLFKLLDPGASIF